MKSLKWVKSKNLDYERMKHRKIRKVEEHKEITKDEKKSSGNKREIKN